MKQRAYKKKITAFEFKCIKGAFLGYMNGDYVASTAYPIELMESGWLQAMTEEQRDSLVLLMKTNKDRLGDKAFGDDQNKHVWEKFLAFMDSNVHYFVELSNGDTMKVFDANDRTYGYELFLKEPRQEKYLRTEIINKKL